MWDTMFLEYYKDVNSPQINLQIQSNPIQVPGYFFLNKNWPADSWWWNGWQDQRAGAYPTRCQNTLS